MKVVERVRFGGRGQGSLIRYEGSDVWYSAYCVRGKEHRESTRTDDLRQAKRVHRQLLDKIAADRQGLKKFLSPVDRGLRVGEVLDWLAGDYRLRHKESPQFKSHLKPVRAHFDDWLVIDLMDESIDAYIEERLEADKVAATINRETQILGQALRLALKRRRIPSMPSIRHLPENNTREGFFERPEFETLVAALPDYLKDFTRFAYLTGWRKGEITSLRWADVDIFSQTVRVRRSKTEAGHRTIPLNRDATLALAKLQERAEAFGSSSPEHCVFPACENRHVDPSTPQKSWRSAWRRLTKAAGFPGFRFHDLRHQAITEMSEAGASDATIMAVAGHVDRAMMEHYSHVRMAAKRDVLQKLESGLMEIPMAEDGTDKTPGRS